MDEVRIQCPIWDLSCPYFNNGLCTMYNEDGTHPKDECDDYIYASGN